MAVKWGGGCYVVVTMWRDGAQDWTAYFVQCLHLARHKNVVLTCRRRGRAQTWCCVTWSRYQHHASSIHPVRCDTSSPSPASIPHSTSSHVHKAFHFTCTHKHCDIIVVIYHTRTEHNIQKLNTHTRLTALCQGLHGWDGTRKVKPIWILLKQETVSGSDISWANWTQNTKIKQCT